MYQGFITFISPYVKICTLAGWGLAQNLEGLGLFKYFNSPQIQVGEHALYVLNLNPAVGVAQIAFLLTCSLAFTFFLSLRAAFYLGKKIGWICLLLWITPGLLAIFGVPFDIAPLGPDVFRLGRGFPGGAGPAGANLFLSFAFGWSAIMLIGIFWPRDRFKNIYDHIWYPLGLVAALYFVIDSALPFYKADTENTDQAIARTIDLYSTSVNQLLPLCQRERLISNLAPRLCNLASKMPGRIKVDLELNHVNKTTLKDSDWIRLLAQDPLLIKEIGSLNQQACTERAWRSACKTIPIDVALRSEDIDKPYLFPPEAYAQALMSYAESQDRVANKIHEIEEDRNIRYFAFLLVAFLAGGKVANVSRALLKSDKVRPSSWIVIILKLVWKLLSFLRKLCRY